MVAGPVAEFRAHVTSACFVSRKNTFEGDIDTFFLEGPLIGSDAIYQKRPILPNCFKLQSVPCHRTQSNFNVMLILC